jgi:hypothetical protein
MGDRPASPPTTDSHRTRRRSSRVLSIAGAVVAMTLVAGGVVTAGRDGGRRPVAGPAPATELAAAAQEVHGAVTAAKTAPPSPGELVLQLQALLGQHTVLAADMMRGRLRDDPDLAQAANAALGKNTDAMGKLVAGAFGSQAAARFTPLWSNHVTALFNYARGLADGDTAVQAQAKVAITRAETDLAEFFVAAAQGRLARAAAVSAVTAHIEHLIGQADAYAAKNWTRADQLYRQGYAHAFELGRALAAKLLPPDAAAVLGTPTWRLRSALTQLLGEHVELVVGAMRAGVTDADDFAATAAAVNANTADLAGAIDTLFGPAAARRFQSLWADHIDLLVGYAAATAKGDTRRRSSIDAELDAFERELAGFLTTATGDKLASAALAKALQSHDTMLRQQVDAFVAKDYATAHDVAYMTYQEMYGLAGQLADAFRSKVASRLPVGAAQTGRGGAASGTGGR